MNITETTTEGLRRQLKVVIAADELERRLSARLDELKGKARLKGFRPGHVPKEHLRKVFGRSVMAETIGVTAGPGTTLSRPARTCSRDR